MVQPDFVRELGAETVGVEEVAIGQRNRIVESCFIHAVFIRQEEVHLSRGVLQEEDHEGVRLLVEVAIGAWPELEEEWNLVVFDPVLDVLRDPLPFVYLLWLQIVELMSGLREDVDT